MIASFLPLIAAIVAGGLIGLEREWRGRAAGFRTHILVCLASALLMEMSVRQGDWPFSVLPDQEIIADPARLAHGVLTGVGLICAGAVFRTGFTVHGLTTAASLWMTTALGLVFGAGLYELGASATVVTLAILYGLRLVSRRLPEHTLTDVTVSWRGGAPSPEAAVLALLREVDPKVQRDAQEMAEDRTRGRTYRIRATDDQLDALAEALAGLPGVASFRLDPRDD